MIGCYTGFDWFVRGCGASIGYDDRQGGKDLSFSGCLIFAK